MPPATLLLRRPPTLGLGQPLSLLESLLSRWPLFSHLFCRLRFSIFPQVRAWPLSSKLSPGDLRTSGRLVDISTWLPYRYIDIIMFISEPAKNPEPALFPCQSVTKSHDFCLLNLCRPGHFVHLAANGLGPATIASLLRLWGSFLVATHLRADRFPTHPPHFAQESS